VSHIFTTFLQPSTFQAVIATDFSDTYVVFFYKEDAMLFDTKKRYSDSNIALIGYTNGVDVEYTEVQGDYRPDKREQNAGNSQGRIKPWLKLRKNNFLYIHETAGSGGP